MAKKDEIVEPTEKPEDIGYTHEELSKQSIREIAEGQELPPPPEEEIKEEPELDEVQKKLAKHITEDVVESLEQKQKEKEQQEEERRLEEERKAKKEEELKNKPKPNEEYQKIVDDFAKENGRPPTWDELATKIEERTVQRLEEREQEKERLAREEQEKQQKAREDEEKRINAFVDDELEDLYKAKKLTPILDPNNPSDQGVVERRELFKTWNEVNQKRKAEGKPEIISPTRIYEFYYKRPSAQPAGLDAPIAGKSNSGTAPSDAQSYSYKDIHNTPWSWFKRK